MDREIERVCVCVCERERESERERKRNRKRERESCEERGIIKMHNVEEQMKKCE